MKKAFTFLLMLVVTFSCNLVGFAGEIVPTSSEASKELLQSTIANNCSAVLSEIKKSETVKASKDLAKSFKPTFEKLKSFILGTAITLAFSKGIFSLSKLFVNIHDHPIFSGFVRDLFEGVVKSNLAWGILMETLMYSPQIIDWIQKVACVGYNYENPDSWRNWMRNDFCKKA